MLGGFAQALLAIGHGTHFARQAELAENHRVLGNRPVTQAGNHHRCHWQVGRSLAHADAAHDVQEHVLVEQGHAPVAVQHGQQHGQPVVLQSHGQAPGIGQGAVVHQRLDLQQQRPAALADAGHHAAGGALVMARQEDRRGMSHLLQSRIRHGEHAQFVHRAEAVLHRPQHPIAPPGVALEGQHGIHHVLQHPRPGQRAVLGDMADEHDDDAALLGEAHQLRRRFAHLAHGAGRAGQLLGVHGLNGVDHHQPRPARLGAGHDTLHRRLRHQRQRRLGQTQPARAQGDLLQ